MGRGTQTAGYPLSSPEYQAKLPIQSYFDLGEIRGRTADVNPTTFIVTVQLGYQLDNKAVQTELVARTPQLEDLVRSFFASKTASELDNPNNENALKQELLNEINNIMISGKIQSVVFPQFNVVPL
jgi:flagellar FliL protein